MRIPFRQGLVTVANSDFLTLSGGFVHLNIVDEPLVAVISAGPKDYMWVEPETVESAWGPITNGQTTYLFIDIDARTGARTFGTTSLAPAVSGTAPSTPAVNQHWYDSVAHQMKVWIGTAWQSKTRVFVARLNNGSVIQSLSIDAPSFTGTQVGDTTEVFAGQILFDGFDGKPVKDSQGRFVTTEDYLRTRILSTAEVKLAATRVEAQAAENLAKYTVVKFSDFGVIEHAGLLTSSLTGQFGIIERDTLVGELVSVITDGVVTNAAWDWTSAGINTLLYCDATGTLASTPQIAGQVPIAVVVDRHSIQLRSPNITMTGATEVNYATGSLPGIVQLSVAPADPDTPTAVGTNDPRLTDARTPTAHTHTLADVTGAITGPASVTNEHLVQFDGTTGKLIKGGLAVTTSTTLAGNSNTNIPTEAAVKAYVDNKPSGDVVGPATATADSLVQFNGTTGKLVKNGPSIGAIIGPGSTALTTETAVKSYVDARVKQSIIIACSDEITAITAGTSKVTFRMPYGFTLETIRASLTAEQTSGSTFTVDVNADGTSILTTKLTIDNTEKTSRTAATPLVLSTTNLADDTEITIDVDQVGDGTARGLKVVLVGTVAALDALNASYTWNTFSSGGLSNTNQIHNWNASSTGNSGYSMTGTQITGKTYSEFVFTEVPGDGPRAVGISSSLVPMFNSGNWSIYSGNGGCGIGATAGFINNGNVNSNGSYRFVKGDRIGVAFDAGTGNLWFRINGTWVSGDPAAGTTPTMTVATGVPYYFYAASYSCSVTGVYEVRIYPSYGSVRATPPVGFKTYQQ